MGVSRGLVMRGCTCGKLIGFKGQHKKRCKLFREIGVSAPPKIAVRASTIRESAPLTPNRFVAAIKGIRQGKAMRNFLEGFLKILRNDTASSAQQKKDAEVAIAAILKELQ